VAGFVCLAVWLAPAGAFAAGPGGAKRVLVLHWGDADSPAVVELKTGMQRVFGSLPPGTIEYYQEYVETDRFPESHVRALADYLRAKYASKPIDVVIALTGAPLNFLLAQPVPIFPGAPIVFTSSRRPPADAMTGQITGIVLSNAYAETVELALDLHPDVTQVFVISGTPERDRRIDIDVRAQLKRLEGRVAFTYLTDLPIADLMATVNAAPKHSLILYLRQSEADAIRVLLNEDVLARVIEAAPVPVYGVTSLSVGSGVVGGVVMNGERIAARVAELTVRLVKGEAARDIPIEMAAITPMFDWRQLQRWRISEERLPAGSVVRFRETSPWEQYRGYLVSALIVFGVQMALIIGLLVERTKRHLAERAWRKSEEQYRRVVETQSEMICRFTPDTTLKFVNEAYCRYWNKSRNELLGTKFIQLIPEFARADVLAHIDVIVGDPRVAMLEHQVLTPDSQAAWHEWRNHSVCDSAGRVIELQGIGRDITARKRAEDALVASYREVQDLARHLVAAQEDERTRIARELHDDLGQRLAVLAMTIDKLSDSAPALAEDDIERIHEISAQTSEIASDVQRLSHDLHPSQLEVLGLVKAVQGLCRDVSRQHHVQVDFRHVAVPNTVAPAVALSLFRITQEALRNIVKHSQATEAAVQLAVVDHEIVLQIADSGVGFRTGDHDRTGLGLISMRERVHLMGGRFVIHSAPGSGTRIGVSVPVAVAIGNGTVAAALSA